jgi:hypothetical protein
MRGPRSRRADAVWLDLTDFNSPLIEVHEIKTNRHDLVAELRHPEKSAPWMQRAHRFWLTIPEPSLLDGLRLPQSWGILTLPAGRPQILRPAPRLIPSIAYPGPGPTNLPRLLYFAIPSIDEPWKLQSQYTVAYRLPLDARTSILKRHTPWQFRLPE